MKRIPRLLMFIALAATAVFLTSLAFAQELAESPSLGEALSDPEALYMLLVLPIVQVLKNHVFDGLLDQLGESRRYGVIGMSLVVGAALGIFFEAIGMLELGFGPALWFGVTAGAVGSGLKDLLLPKRSSLAPASDTSTDAARDRLYR